MKIVSAEEAVIKELLILLEKTYLKRFYDDLEDDVLINISDSNYTNNELSYQYILHFNR